VVSSEQACELEIHRFGLLPMNDTDHDPLAGIPAHSIAQWEQWGVDVIENDLKMKNGIGYVGQPVKEAWRWVKHKRAQENAAPAGNSITIGVMTGSTIQQGSPSATQTVSIRLDRGDVESAVAAFEAAVDAADFPAATVAELKGDIATIRAQLSKASPMPSILQEAGRSMRNVVEGIAAGLFTPEVLAAAPALWAALGLG
jgi:hypothetical protein